MKRIIKNVRLKRNLKILRNLQIPGIPRFQGILGSLGPKNPRNTREPRNPTNPKPKNQRNPWNLRISGIPEVLGIKESEETTINNHKQKAIKHNQKQCISYVLVLTYNISKKNEKKHSKEKMKKTL